MEHDAAAQEFQREFNASIEDTLLHEARRNELIIANVRAIAVGFVVFLDTLLYANPLGAPLLYVSSITTVYLAAFWLIVSIMVLIVLRSGWYRPWLRIGLSLSDGLMVFSHVTIAILTAENIQTLMPVVVSTASACALLAVSGSLRMTPTAAWLTTALGIAIFVAVSIFTQFPLMEMLFTCTLLISIGFMGMWMSNITRRSMESEVSRLVLQRFLPKEVVDGAYHKPLSIIAEPRRMNVTVVISDLRGFTAYAESVFPEQAFAHLNAIQSLLAATVDAYKGKVDKFMGDGILAVFGMNSNEVDHARQGINAALAMVEEAKKLAMLTRTPIRLGVGVHSGPVMVGCIGMGRRVEFTVLGDTVNVASRLQELTKEKGVEILVSGESWSQVLQRNEDTTRSLIMLEEVHIRGRQSPLEVFTTRTT